MLDLARNKAAQISSNPVANLLISMASVYIVLIGLTYQIRTSTCKQVNKNVHECPHIPSTALVHCSHLGCDPSSRLVHTFI
jgi:hypothetical protein